MDEFRFDGAAEFPEALGAAWRGLSCLKAGEHAAVWLCEARADGARAIVKLVDAEDEAEQLRNEYRLLRLIADSGRPEAAGFPRALACEDLPDGRRAFIRSAIPGDSIDAIVEAQPDRPGIAPDRVIGWMISVLEQVAFLHGLNPPVIHRDIKPQNVIVDARDGCHLIDLGISRIHRAGDVADTCAIGTRLTAPPEQFGFRQTDARSDIYSVGVLMRYCLTGEYTDASDGALDPALRRVVARATQFDPELRYQDAQEMRADLARLRKTLRRRNGCAPRRALGRLTERASEWVQDLMAARRAARRARGPAHPNRRRGIAAACALAAIAAGAALALLPNAGSGGVRFREPLIEQAVRAQLGRPEGPLTREELAGVERLHIIGRQVYASEDGLWFWGDYVYFPDAGAIDPDLAAQNGGIRSLDDLRLLPNLRELSLYRQQISDISALRGTTIERLGLGYNPIGDLSPLEGNSAVRQLNLSCLGIDSLAPVLTMRNLESLVLNGTAVRSLEGIEALPLLWELNLFSTPVTDCRPLARCPALKALTLGALDEALVDTMRQMNLVTLFVIHSTDVPIEALSGLTSLERLYYQADAAYTLDDAPLDLPGLTWLDLKNVRLESLAPLSGMQSLDTLNLYASECADFSGLDALGSLRRIDCTAEQAAAIEALYPDPRWQLLY